MQYYIIYSFVCTVTCLVRGSKDVSKYFNVYLDPLDDGFSYRNNINLPRFVNKLLTFTLDNNQRAWDDFNNTNISSNYFINDLSAKNLLNNVSSSTNMKIFPELNLYKNCCLLENRIYNINSNNKNNEIKNEKAKYDRYKIGRNLKTFTVDEDFTENPAEDFHDFDDDKEIYRANTITIHLPGKKKQNMAYKESYHKLFGFHKVVSSTSNDAIISKPILTSDNPAVTINTSNSGQTTVTGKHLYESTVPNQSISLSSMKVTSEELSQPISSQVTTQEIVESDDLDTTANAQEKETSILLEIEIGLVTKSTSLKIDKMSETHSILTTPNKMITSTKRSSPSTASLTISSLPPSSTLLPSSSPPTASSTSLPLTSSTLLPSSSPPTASSTSSPLTSSTLLPSSSPPTASSPLTSLSSPPTSSSTSLPPTSSSLPTTSSTLPSSSPSTSSTSSPLTTSLSSSSLPTSSSISLPPTSSSTLLPSSSPLTASSTSSPLTSSTLLPSSSPPTASSTSSTLLPSSLPPTASSTLPSSSPPTASSISSLLTSSTLLPSSLPPTASSTSSPSTSSTLSPSSLLPISSSFITSSTLLPSSSPPTALSTSSPSTTSSPLTTLSPLSPSTSSSSLSTIITDNYTMVFNQTSITPSKIFTLFNDTQKPTYTVTNMTTETTILLIDQSTNQTITTYTPYENSTLQINGTVVNVFNYTEENATINIDLTTGPKISTENITEILKENQTDNVTEEYSHVTSSTTLTSKSTNYTITEKFSEEIKNLSTELVLLSTTESLLKEIDNIIEKNITTHKDDDDGGCKKTMIELEKEGKELINTLNEISKKEGELEEKEKDVKLLLKEWQEHKSRCLEKYQNKTSMVTSETTFSASEKNITTGMTEKTEAVIKLTSPGTNLIEITGNTMESSSVSSTAGEVTKTEIQMSKATLSSSEVLTFKSTTLQSTTNFFGSSMSSEKPIYTTLSQLPSTPEILSTTVATSFYTTFDNKSTFISSSLIAPMNMSSSTSESEASGETFPLYSTVTEYPYNETQGLFNSTIMTQKTNYSTPTTAFSSSQSAEIIPMGNLSTLSSPLQPKISTEISITSETSEKIESAENVTIALISMTSESSEKSASISSTEEENITSSTIIGMTTEISASTEVQNFSSTEGSSVSEIFTTESTFVQGTTNFSEFSPHADVYTAVNLTLPSSPEISFTPVETSFHAQFNNASTFGLSSTSKLGVPEENSVSYSTVTGYLFNKTLSSLSSTTAIVGNYYSTLITALLSSSQSEDTSVMSNLSISSSTTTSPKETPTASLSSRTSTSITPRVSEQATNVSLTETENITSSTIVEMTSGTKTSIERQNFSLESLSMTEIPTTLSATVQGITNFSGSYFPSDKEVQANFSLSPSTVESSSSTVGSSIYTTFDNKSTFTSPLSLASTNASSGTPKLEMFEETFPAKSTIKEYLINETQNLLNSTTIAEKTYYSTPMTASITSPQFTETSPMGNLTTLSSLSQPEISTEILIASETTEKIKSEENVTIALTSMTSESSEKSASISSTEAENITSSTIIGMTSGIKTSTEKQNFSVESSIMSEIPTTLSVTVQSITNFSGYFFPSDKEVQANFSLSPSTLELSSSTVGTSFYTTFDNKSTSISSPSLASTDESSSSLRVEVSEEILLLNSTFEKYSSYQTQIPLNSTTATLQTYYSTPTTNLLSLSESTNTSLIGNSSSSTPLRSTIELETNHSTPITSSISMTQSAGTSATSKFSTSSLESTISTKILIASKSSEVTKIGKNVSETMTSISSIVSEQVSNVSSTKEDNITLFTTVQFSSEIETSVEIQNLSFVESSTTSRIPTITSTTIASSKNFSKSSFPSSDLVPTSPGESITDMTSISSEVSKQATTTSLTKEYNITSSSTVELISKLNTSTEKQNFSVESSSMTEIPTILSTTVQSITNFSVSFFPSDEGVQANFSLSPSTLELSSPTVGTSFYTTFDNKSTFTSSSSLAPLNASSSTPKLETSEGAFLPNSTIKQFLINETQSLLNSTTIAEKTYYSTPMTASITSTEFTETSPMGNLSTLLSPMQHEISTEISITSEPSEKIESAENVTIALISMTSESSEKTASISSTEEENITSSTIIGMTTEISASTEVQNFSSTEGSSVSEIFTTESTFVQDTTNFSEFSPSHADVYTAVNLTLPSSPEISFTPVETSFHAQFNNASTFGLSSTSKLGVPEENSVSYSTVTGYLFNKTLSSLSSTTAIVGNYYSTLITALLSSSQSEDTSVISNLSISSSTTTSPKETPTASLSSRTSTSITPRVSEQATNVSLTETENITLSTMVEMKFTETGSMGNLSASSSSLPPEFSTEISIASETTEKIKSEENVTIALTSMTSESSEKSASISSTEAENITSSTIIEMTSGMKTSTERRNFSVESSIMSEIPTTLSATVLGITNFSGSYFLSDKEVQANFSLSPSTLELSSSTVGTSFYTSFDNESTFISSPSSSSTEESSTSLRVDNASLVTTQYAENATEISALTNLLTSQQITNTTSTVIIPSLSSDSNFSETKSTRLLQLTTPILKNITTPTFSLVSNVTDFTTSSTLTSTEESTTSTQTIFSSPLTSSSLTPLSSIYSENITLSPSTTVEMFSTQSERAINTSTFLTSGSSVINATETELLPSVTTKILTTENITMAEYTTEEYSKIDENMTTMEILSSRLNQKSTQTLQLSTANLTRKTSASESFSSIQTLISNETSTEQSTTKSESVSTASLYSEIMNGTSSTLLFVEKTNETSTPIYSSTTEGLKIGQNDTTYLSSSPTVEEFASIYYKSSTESTHYQKNITLESSVMSKFFSTTPFSINNTISADQFTDLHVTETIYLSKTPSSVIERTENVSQTSASANLEVTKQMTNMSSTKEDVTLSSTVNITSEISSTTISVGSEQVTTMSSTKRDNITSSSTVELVSMIDTSTGNNNFSVELSSMPEIPTTLSATVQGITNFSGSYFPSDKEVQANFSLSPSTVELSSSTVGTSFYTTFDNKSTFTSPLSLASTNASSGTPKLEMSEETFPPNSTVEKYLINKTQSLLNFTTIAEKTYYSTPMNASTTSTQFTETSPMGNLSTLPTPLQPEISTEISITSETSEKIESAENVTIATTSMTSESSEKSASISSTEAENITSSTIIEMTTETKTSTEGQNFSSTEDSNVSEISTTESTSVQGTTVNLTLPSSPEILFTPVETSFHAQFNNASTFGLSSTTELEMSEEISVSYSTANKYVSNGTQVSLNSTTIALEMSYSTPMTPFISSTQSVKTSTSGNLPNSTLKSTIPTETSTTSVSSKVTEIIDNVTKTSTSITPSVSEQATNVSSTATENITSSKIVEMTSVTETSTEKQNFSAELSGMTEIPTLSATVQGITNFSGSSFSSDEGVQANFSLSPSTLELSSSTVGTSFYTTFDNKSTFTSTLSLASTNASSGTPKLEMSEETFPPNSTVEKYLINETQNLLNSTTIAEKTYYSTPMTASITSTQFTETSPMGNLTTLSSPSQPEISTEISIASKTTEEIKSEENVTIALTSITLESSEKSASISSTEAENITSSTIIGMTSGMKTSTERRNFSVESSIMSEIPTTLSVTVQSITNFSGYFFPSDKEVQANFSLSPSTLELSSSTVGTSFYTTFDNKSILISSPLSSLTEESFTSLRVDNASLGTTQYAVNTTEILALTNLLTSQQITNTTSTVIIPSLLSSDSNFPETKSTRLLQLTTPSLKNITTPSFSLVSNVTDFTTSSTLTSTEESTTSTQTILSSPLTSSSIIPLSSIYSENITLSPSTTVEMFSTQSERAINTSTFLTSGSSVINTTEIELLPSVTTEIMMTENITMAEYTTEEYSKIDENMTTMEILSSRLNQKSTQTLQLSTANLTRKTSASESLSSIQTLISNETSTEQSTTKSESVSTASLYSEIMNGTSSTPLFAERTNETSTPFYSSPTVKITVAGVQTTTDKNDTGSFSSVSTAEESKSIFHELSTKPTDFYENTTSESSVVSTFITDKTFIINDSSSIHDLTYGHTSKTLYSSSTPSIVTESTKNVTQTLALTNSKVSEQVTTMPFTKEDNITSSSTADLTTKIDSSTEKQNFSVVEMLSTFKIPTTSTTEQNIANFSESLLSSDKPVYTSLNQLSTTPEISSTAVETSFHTTLGNKSTFISSSLLASMDVSSSTLKSETSKEMFPLHSTVTESLYNETQILLSSTTTAPTVMTAFISSIKSAESSSMDNVSIPSSKSSILTEIPTTSVSSRMTESVENITKISTSMISEGSEQSASISSTKEDNVTSSTIIEMTAEIKTSSEGQNFSVAEVSSTSKIPTTELTTVQSTTNFSATYFSSDKDIFTTLSSSSPFSSEISSTTAGTSFDTQLDNVSTLTSFSTSKLETSGSTFPLNSTVNEYLIDKTQFLLNSTSIVPETYYSTPLTTALISSTQSTETSVIGNLSTSFSKSAISTILTASVPLKITENTENVTESSTIKILTSTVIRNITPTPEIVSFTGPDNVSIASTPSSYLPSTFMTFSSSDLSLATEEGKTESMISSDYTDSEVESSESSSEFITEASKPLKNLSSTDAYSTDASESFHLSTFSIYPSNSSQISPLTVKFIPSLSSIDFKKSTTENITQSTISSSTVKGPSTILVYPTSIIHGVPMDYGDEDFNKDFNSTIAEEFTESSTEFSTSSDSSASLTSSSLFDETLTTLTDATTLTSIVVNQTEELVNKIIDLEDKLEERGDELEEKLENQRQDLEEKINDLENIIKDLTTNIDSSVQSTDLLHEVTEVNLYSTDENLTRPESSSLTTVFNADENSTIQLISPSDEHLQTTPHQTELVKKSTLDEDCYDDDLEAVNDQYFYDGNNDIWSGIEADAKLWSDLDYDENYANDTTSNVMNSKKNQTLYNNDNNNNNETSVIVKKRKLLSTLITGNNKQTHESSNGLTLKKRNDNQNLLKLLNMMKKTLKKISPRSNKRRNIFDEVQIAFDNIIDNKNNVSTVNSRSVGNDDVDEFTEIVHPSVEKLIPWQHDKNIVRKHSQKHSSKTNIVHGHKNKTWIFKELHNYHSNKLLMPKSRVITNNNNSPKRNIENPFDKQKIHRQMKVNSTIPGMENNEFGIKEKLIIYVDKLKSIPKKKPGRQVFQCDKSYKRSGNNNSMNHMRYERDNKEQIQIYKINDYRHNNNNNNKKHYYNKNTKNHQERKKLRNHKWKKKKNFVKNSNNKFYKNKLIHNHLNKKLINKKKKNHKQRRKNNITGKLNLKNKNNWDKIKNILYKEKNNKSNNNLMMNFAKTNKKLTRNFYSENKIDQIGNDIEKLLKETENDNTGNNIRVKKSKYFGKMNRLIANNV